MHPSAISLRRVTCELEHRTLDSVYSGGFDETRLEFCDSIRSAPLLGFRSKHVLPGHLRKLLERVLSGCVPAGVFYGLLPGEPKSQRRVSHDVGFGMKLIDFVSQGTRKSYGSCTRKSYGSCWAEGEEQTPIRAYVLQSETDFRNHFWGFRLLRGVR